MWFECWAQGGAGNTGLCMIGSCEGGRKASRGGGGRGGVSSLAPDGVLGAVYRLRCGCNLVFLLVQGALLDFYLKTILMSKTKPQKHVLVSQSIRAACDVVPQAALPCAECPVPFAGQLFSVASLHVPRRVQGLCSANSAEIPAAES